MEWISVNDRLPETGDLVIGVGQWQGEISGLDEEFVIGLGEWDNNKIVIYGDIYTVYLVNVTYWMPLPEAPKE